MTSLQNRERAFEAAFAHDEQRAFRARILALRKLARWAAERRGRATPEADAEAFVARALRGEDDDKLLGALAADLKDADVSLHRLRVRFAALVQEASREVQG